MKKRCPKCNSSLIKHVKSTSMSKNKQTYTEAGLGVAGAVLGSFFGPTGVKLGSQIGAGAGKLIASAGEDEHDECLSCGYKF